VRKVEEMPECFSRPICKFAMRLNDSANETERQRLLPFVTRLACADTPDVEAKRAAFINSKHVYSHSFEYGLKVLEEALVIGLQADAMPAADVRSRMDEVQSRASRPTSLGDSPVFSKVKSWFEPKKQTEPGR
jgi:hypothetical protein